jgi:hypothetical protein
MNDNSHIPTGRGRSSGICLERYGLTVDEKQILIPAIRLSRCLTFLIENDLISHNLLRGDKK